MTPSSAGTVDKRDTTRDRVVVAALSTLFAAYFLWLCVLKWRAYGYGDFDLPIFDQAVWSTARLDGVLPSSIRFGSVFADHAPLILLAAVPFYWLFDRLVPGPVILLALQALAVASAAIPLHRLALREAGRVAALAVVAAFLLHPATGYMVLFEFHPVTFAVPFLCWAAWALHVRRWRTFVTFTLLALACREDVALPVAGLGVFALWRAWRGGLPMRSWDTLRWAMVPGVVAAVWFVVAVFAVIPASQPEGHPSTMSPFVWLYAHHAGPDVRTAGDVIAGLALHPFAAVARSAEHKAVGTYTWQLLAPTAGLAVLSPVALLPALPTWFLNVTNAKLETSSVCYQYSAGILPFVFIGTIRTLAWAGRLPFLRGRPLTLPVVLVVSALLSSFAWGKVASPFDDPLDARHRPEEPLQLYRTDYDRDVTDRARDQLIALVPRHASLVASFGFLHRVPMRPELYSWHYVRTGVDPVNGAPVTIPQTEYALLDTSDVLTFGSFGGAESGARQRAYLESYRIVARAGPSVLLVNAPVGRHLRVLSFMESSSTLPKGLDPDGSGLVAVASRVRPANEDPEDEDDDHGESGAQPYRVTASWAATEGFLDEARRATDGFTRFGTVWTTVSLRGADGTHHDTRFSLSHGMNPISEWEGFDPADPEKEHAVVTATYPVRVPPGSWRVIVYAHVEPDVGPRPLAALDLGDVSVP